MQAINGNGRLGEEPKNKKGFSANTLPTTTKYMYMYIVGVHRKNDSTWENPNSKKSNSIWNIRQHV